jgi:hypothetical protein
MKPVLIIISFTLTLHSCTTKTVEDSDIEIVAPPELNPNNYDEIGFACGEGGGETNLVREFTNFIKDKKYKKLKAGLYSKKPGVIYLATFSCKKLASEDMIKLNKTELKQIENNLRKTDTIYTCSGCTEFEHFTINQLFNDTTNYIRTEAGYWFDEIFEPK